MMHFRPQSSALFLAALSLVVAGAVPAQAGRRGGGHAGGGHHAGVAHHGGGGFASHAAPFYTGGRYTGFTVPRFGAAGSRAGYFGFRSANFGYRSGYLGFGLGYLGYGSGYGFGSGAYGFVPTYNFLGAPYGLGLGPYGTAYNPYMPPAPWYDGPIVPPTFGPDPPPEVRAHPPAPGQVEVLVPRADAEVLFDGQKTTLTGMRRVYPTPNLAPGRRYWYRVSASWLQNGETVHEERTVFVGAGDTTVVNFRK